MLGIGRRGYGMGLGLRFVGVGVGVRAGRVLEVGREGVRARGVEGGRLGGRRSV